MTEPWEKPPSTVRSGAMPCSASRLVEPGGYLRIGRVEGLGVGIAHLAYGVPVGAAGRERQRAARGGTEQTPIGIEHVEQRKQVVLVRAAPVEEHQRPFRVACRGPI